MKEISACDQSDASGNTFITKKWRAEEMVEQPLADLESTKTKRPRYFTWLLTTCLNATDPVALKKKYSCWDKTKDAVNYWLLIRPGVSLLKGGLAKASTSTPLNEERVGKVVHRFEHLASTKKIIQDWVSYQWNTSKARTLSSRTSSKNHHLFRATLRNLKIHESICIQYICPLFEMK